MPTPDRTSLAEIVAAGLTLLESGGPPAVTMKAIAVRVGVRAPSLYKRVRDREALLKLLAEASVEELTAQLEASESTLPAIARTYRAFAIARPQGFRHIFATTGAAAVLDQAVAPILEAAAALVGQEEALNAARLLAAWATGFVSMELIGAFRLGGDIDEAFEFGIAHLQAGLVRADVDGVPSGSARSQN